MFTEIAFRIEFLLKGTKVEWIKTVKKEIQFRLFGMLRDHYPYGKLIKVFSDVYDTEDSATLVLFNGFIKENSKFYKFPRQLANNNKKYILSCELFSKEEPVNRTPTNADANDQPLVYCDENYFYVENSDCIKILNLIKLK